MSVDVLPAWRRVLVVVAHPDDESFGLGAVIDSFVRGGAQVRVHCLTQGEASSLGAEDGDLASVRADELARAAAELGVTQTTLSNWPDGRLAAVEVELLEGELGDLVDRWSPDGVLVFDASGITGHPDHVAASASALRVAATRGLPALAWTLSEDVATELAAAYGVGFSGHALHECDVFLTVDRTRQRRAIAAHASQAVPSSVLWRRLELQGDTELLRLIDPTPGPPRPIPQPIPQPKQDPHKEFPG
ncbi:MAG: PIG-L deacetylase family protein [Candidatus Phosphoribacter sp.]|nr:PIG-L family deacetylase [Actinomycetales bacterium]